MKMLTVTLFVCAMMVLTRATPLPQTEDQPEPVETTVESTTDADSWTTGPKEPDDNHDGYELSCSDGWTMCRTGVCCLRYVAEHLTWTEAERNCQSGMGTLANVIETLDDIYDVMKTAGHKNGQIWVGACNTSEDPDWPMSMIHGRATYAPHCLQVGADTDADYKFRTAETTEESGNAHGCLNETQCDARLPSVCSVILM